MRKTFLIILILAEFGFSAQPALAQTASDAASSAVLKSTQIQPDSRVGKLTIFLKKYSSPLASYAGEFVSAADTYDLDWRLVPAITGVESTFGRQIPARSFNAYGWNNGAFKFKSWENSIWQVSAALRENYLNKGTDNIWKIGRRYAPPSPTWAGRVIRFMAQIEATSDFTLDL